MVIRVSLLLALVCCRLLALEHRFLLREINIRSCDSHTWLVLFIVFIVLNKDLVFQFLVVFHFYNLPLIGFIQSLYMLLDLLELQCLLLSYH